MRGRRFTVRPAAAEFTALRVIGDRLARVFREQIVDRCRPAAVFSSRPRRQCTLAVLIPVAWGLLSATARPDDPARLELERSAYRLSSGSFEERADAERSLREAGAPALPVLRELLDAGDLELQLRAQRLINVLERDHLSATLHVLSDGGLPEDPGVLPGWNVYVRMLGDEPRQRSLFVEMVRAEPQLMAAIDDAVELRTEFERRCGDINLQRAQRQTTEQTVASVAALLLAATHPDCRPSAAAAACINASLQEGEFLSEMSRTDRPAALERLVASWVSLPESSTAIQRLGLAARFELAEGVDVAQEIIKQRLYGPQIQQAILYIAKVGAGETEHLHILEELLADETDLQAQRRGSRTTFSARVQDVALAGLLHMTRQNPSDYGFTTLRENSQYLYTPGTIGFESDEARADAIQKWRRWSARNLKDVQPVSEQAAQGVTG